MKNKILVLLCAAIGLTGCNEKLTYEYLVQHPMVLKAEVERCQSGEQPNQADCPVIMNAATNFAAMYNDRQQQPEKFGERLLALQLELTQFKNKYMAARKNLSDLKAKQAAQNDIQAAQVEVVAAEKAYLDQRTEVRMMLAVIGIDSPE